MGKPSKLKKLKKAQELEDSEMPVIFVPNDKHINKETGRIWADRAIVICDAGYYSSLRYSLAANKKMGLQHGKVLEMEDGVSNESTGS